MSFYDTDYGNDGTKGKKLVRSRMRGRLSDPSHKLKETAELMQRDYVAAGLNVNPLGPSEDDVRSHLKAQRAEERRKAKGEPEVWYPTGIVFSELD